MPFLQNVNAPHSQTKSSLKIVLKLKNFKFESFSVVFVNIVVFWIVASCSFIAKTYVMDKHNL
jgi:hypothetical protein